MNFSYYRNVIPYSVIWTLIRIFKKNLPTVFYCRDLIDWYAFQPVYKHLPKVVIVSDKKKVIRALNVIGIKVKKLPCFPKAVIMCRNYHHIFPHKKIIKIGIRNSPYHFKSITNIKEYNRFDLYLFTSKADLQSAEQAGINNGKAIGYPKLDPAFDGTYDSQYLNNIKKNIPLDPEKTTILVSATWYKSDMSAIFFWYKRLGEIVKFYNILVTVHPWMDKKFIKKIKKTEDVIFLEEANVIPYIMIADVCISDTGSIIAECCALDKPIITFKVLPSERTVPQTEKIVEKISYRINTFSQLILAIEYVIKNKSELAEERKLANIIFFDDLDGKASLRASKEIKKLLKNNLV